MCQYYNMHFNGIDEGLSKIKGNILLGLFKLRDKAKRCSWMNHRLKPGSTV